MSEERMFLDEKTSCHGKHFFAKTIFQAASVVAGFMTRLSKHFAFSLRLPE
jgi:hypothetical protein